jgi:hypothetical protein
LLRRQESSREPREMRQRCLRYWAAMMFAVRAIGIFGGVLLLLLAVASAWPFQSRIEDRTDSKIEAREHAVKPPKPGKRTVWNLDGGVFFATDGHLPNGSCFRLQGQMIAPEFFQGLRRVDTDQASTYVHGNKVVTEYPDQVQIVLHLLDYPCSPDLKDTTVRPPITREMMGTLRLNFYWKEGVHMTPVEDTRRIGASVRRIGSFATGTAAEELAPRLEWDYAFAVDSEKVPLTEDLVLVIENPEHKICARVAARL